MYVLIAHSSTLKMSQKILLKLTTIYIKGALTLR